MSLIWHDAAKERRLARSQPLQLDVVCVLAWAAVVLLTAAWVRALWLGIGMALRWLLR